MKERGKKFYSVLFLFLFQTLAYAQTDVIDSLQKLMKVETTDSGRSNLMNQLSYAYKNSKPDTALLLAQEGLSLARKAGFKKAESRSLNLIGIVFENTGNYPKALENCLESLKIAESIGDGLEVAKVLGAIANVYNDQGDYRKSIDYSLKSLAGFEVLHNQRGVTIQLANLGDTYETLNMLDSARFYNNHSYALAMQFQDAGLTGITLNNLGNIYSKMGQNGMALNYYRSGLPFLKQEGNDEGFCETYLGLAKLFQKAGNTDSCLYYAKLSLSIAKKDGFTNYLMNACNFLTSYYRSLHNTDSAFAYQSAAIVAKDSLFSQEKTREIQGLTFDETMRKQQIEEERQQAQAKLKQNGLAGGMVTLLLAGFLLYRNNRQKQKANKVLQQSYSNIELLEEIGKKITSSLSVEKIIATAYNNVNSLMDANVFGIGIYNDVLKRIEFPATYEDGKPLPFYTNAIDDKNRFAAICFGKGEEIIMGNLSEDYKKYVQDISTPHGGQPVSLIFLPLVLKDKRLGVLTVQSFQKNAYTEYHVFMLRNIAIYTAIAVENASSYETLKATQAQLIQSEKMASLGELTAGIAHEIQNPLNFVNNFSEVSNELIDEMKTELVTGNQQEAIGIAEDIKRNLEKIHHHGKRADAIVKGMLQHSRSSTGVKEPTDINALADEYVRLSYHGLRAKDKSFYAEIKTGFDNSIGKINIVPQDIGRVVLNLLNNAFYACAERSRSAANGDKDKNCISYKPTVSVRTEKSADSVLITVSDNGKGIPEKVVNKIFQPFFTTKPTGDGTGLGLSLSYDIIKAHGGQIKVKTREEEGTEFVIQLPM